MISFYILAGFFLFQASQVINRNLPDNEAKKIFATWFFLGIGCLVIAGNLK